MQANSSVSPIDIEALDELRRTVGDKLDTLFDTLELQGREVLDDLRTLAENPDAGNSGEFKKAVHKLKGSALSLYCHQLAEHCVRLEQTAFQQSTDFHGLFADFEKVLTKSSKAIADWKSSYESR